MTSFMAGSSGSLGAAGACVASMTELGGGAPDLMAGAAIFVEAFAGGSDGLIGSAEIFGLGGAGSELSAAGAEFDADSVAGLPAADFGGLPAELAGAAADALAFAAGVDGTIEAILSFSTRTKP